jgi:PhnB protein
MASVTPYLIVRNAKAAIEFYQTVFGATLAAAPLTDDMGRVTHSELRVGEARFYLADEHPDQSILSPQTTKGASVYLVHQVANVDAQVERAVAAGSKIVRPVEDSPYCGRTGKIADPYGHVWIFMRTA